MMIYLASPYSHPDYSIRLQRYLNTRQFTWSHLRIGIIMFSPIVYGHQFAQSHGAETDAQTWAALNEKMMKGSEEIWVLQLDGWETSLGVGQEIEFALTHEIPLRMKEITDAPL